MSAIDLQHPLIVCRASAGTGKTFTLSAYYVAMLLSGESYRNILAVTFTNAATAEMKERILTYLMGIAAGGQQEFLNKVREYMFRDNDATDDLLRHRADECLHAILQDYDNFAVTTIDSFLQQLIRGMALALNRTADFAISLDADQVIANAVDAMLTSELTDDSKRTVYEYVAQCIGDSKSWDIRHNLIRIGQQLYKESVQIHSTRLSSDSQLELDEQRIADYRKALLGQRAQALATFKQMAIQAKADLDAGAAYIHGRNAATAIENMYKSATAPDSMKKSDLFRGATDKGMADVLSVPQLADLQQACDVMRHTWWQITCSLTYLNDMRLMRALEDSIQRSLINSNTALLAETAVTLVEALQPGDADFILEKAGIRFRHIMIDEFQDTSLLQWNVFLHLIREILAAPGQTILIVGDTKQSIYRFRNGDWQIMESLGKTELVRPFNPNTAPLIRNQRSRKTIVRFNIGVMNSIARQDNLQYPVSAHDNRPVGTALYGTEPDTLSIDAYYRTDKHEGGYVECRFYPYYDKRSAVRLANDARLKQPQQQALWHDVCATIEQLLASGEQPQDILLLARYNGEIQDWVNFCREQGGQYPILNATQMVSRDSFRLESCTTVLLLIEALRYLHTGNMAAAEYVRLHRSDDAISSIDTIDKSTPLYDQLQHLLQIIGCEQGTYAGSDVAYVNCLLDQVQTFIATNGSDARALLQYWDDKLHQFAIAGDSSSNAIRLMTIHSSKGLEGKSVVLLNAAWKTEQDRDTDVLWSEALHIAGSSLPYIPVKQSADLGLTGEHSLYYTAYKREHEAQLIDNYNLLYVALTRAADNLFVFALLNATEHDRGYPTVAASLMDYCQLRDRLTDFADSGTNLLQFSEGDIHIHRPEKERAAGTFDYSVATPLDAVIYSDGDQVHFQQSQESMQYTLDADNADANTAQTDFGLLCHDIFAHIERQSDAQHVLDYYRQQGLVESDEQYRRIHQLLQQAFASEQMRQWFDGSWQVMREWAIITPTANIRPDRVMIKGDTAVVLDYKFTNQQRPGYILQVRDYMQALKQMGYVHVEGWLWFAFTNQLLAVK